MFKNMLKRSWLSITRKPSKSIILGLILFVMANLVLASIVINNSVDENVEYAKEALGGEVYLNVDMEKMMEGMSSGGTMGMDKSSFTRPDITIDMVSSIASSEYVLDYSYSLNSSANLVDLELVEVESTGGMTDRIQGMENIGDIRISGYNSYAFIPEVSNNSIDIYEGEYFDEGTDNGILISLEFSTQNELVVGDVIELQNPNTEEIFEYEVIGIFTSTESGYENSIYTNIDSTANLLSSEMYNGGDYSVSSVIFYLTSADYKDLFIEDANELYPDLEENNLILDINTSAYDKMAGPIEQVGGFASTIMIAVIIASVLIISLLINNNIKDRKYEMGVLMSLGATKKNIFYQIFTELIIVATVAFTLSIGTSYFLAGYLSESVLDSQLETSTEISENNFERPSMGGMSRPGILNTSGNLDDVEVIDEIDVSVNVGDYVLLFSLGYIISLASTFIPAMNIVKYEPKSILTGRQ